MKKATKGAFAAGTATVLLMGGAGTLAYWSDTEDGDAGSITAGSLDLSDVACDEAWEEDGAPVALLVPGDTVTKTCTATLTLVGDHIGATVDLTPTSVAAAETAFNNEIDIAAVLTEPTGGEVTAPGVHDVTVTITVDFPGAAATNASQTDTALLDGLTLEAVQTHDTTP